MDEPNERTRKNLEAIFCLRRHNCVLPIFKQSLHLSTIRPSTTYSNSQSSSPPRRQCSPASPHRNHPAHHRRRDQHNGTTHKPILLDNIPENPGPRTTTACFSPLRQHHRRRDQHHPITAVEDTDTSHHPSKILADIADIEKCLDIVATLQAKKYTEFFPPTPLAFKMKPKTTAVPRAQRSKSYQGDGPNWVLIAGGALLSTLSIRLGYKLKQALDTKPQENASNGSAKSPDQRKPAGCRVHSNVYSFTQQNDGGCFNCMSGTEGMMEMKCLPNDQTLTESNGALPLVMVPAPGFNKENGIVWASSPDRLELPPKPFLHYSNSSDSPCVSESGSDIFSKREVIQKLRQQLKRRDDMILEMQDQIEELQSSLNAQLAHSTNLQSQLDSANRDFFDSEREIQRLRKAIADHCVGHVSPIDRSPQVTIWQPEERNGHVNGFPDGESNFDATERGRGDGERVEMLKREVGELKEVIEGKEYLLQSYKEQKAEFSLKIKELQQRLDSQLPNIL